MHPVHYFVHVPKTAGVTVRTWLRNVYARDEVVFVYPGQLQEAPDALCYPQKQLVHGGVQLPPNLRVLFGHYIFDPDLLVGPESRAVSIVRDPRARLLSWRRYVQKAGAGLPDPMLQRIHAALHAGTSLPDACSREGGVPELDNGIVRMFANVSGPVGEATEASVEHAMRVVEQFFDYIGHVDWFEHSMQRIAAVLGRPYEFVASKNVSAGGRSEGMLATDDSIDESWLHERTHLDVRFVDWLRDRFPPPVEE